MIGALLFWMCGVQRPAEFCPIDRIAEMVSPRSSLIISDEALSSETGEGTEFVVLMSGEPQGGLKHRRHDPQIDRYDRLPYWRTPIAGPYSTWWSRF
jgi:hypothetical protein